MRNKTKIFVVVCGALSAAVPFAVYLISLPPTVTFEDSGQIITAAATLGISHPSGYPLESHLGQFFTLVPISRIAWRVNLASAAAAAACCFFLYLLLRRLFLDLDAGARVAAAASAAAAAAAFGLSRTFWSQAVVTEAYAVNALGLAAVLYAAFNFVRTRDARWGYLAAFAGGLTLGAHTSSTIITVPVLVYLIWRFRKVPSFSGAFAALAFVLLGAGIYLYLPVRAVQGPAIDWGDPRTLARAYAHITRRIYGGAEPLRLLFLPHQLLELGKFLWWEFTPPGVVAVVAGAFLALKRGAAPWVFLFLLLLLTGPLATVALVLLLQAHQIPGIQVWVIPFFLLSALFLGLTLFEIVRRRRAWVRRPGYAALAAAVILPLAFNFYWNDYRNFYFSEDYAANFLRTIAYRGLNIMFERGSLGTFETAYLKKVEWYRPDHVFVDATGSVYREYARFAEWRLGAPDPLAAGAWERAFEQSILNSPEQREIYYSIYRQEFETYGFALEPAGMLYRVTRPPLRQRPVSPVWRRYRMRGVAEVEANPTARRYLAEDWVRYAICMYKSMLAREYLLAGEEERALATVEAAAPLARDMTESLLEIANIYVANRNYKKALFFYDRTLEAFPRKGVGDEGFRRHYAQILANKGLIYLYSGDVDAAEAAIRESLEVCPDQPVIREWADRENLERAAKQFSRVGE